MNTNQYN